jgi:hypothetical protein
MGSRHGDRGTKKKKRERQSAPGGAKQQQHYVKHDSAFGSIPLIPVTYEGPSGQKYEVLQFDPDYEPPLPRGAVRGDVRKQHYCPVCHVPKYFYQDITKTCLQCGADFVFSASEQKYWYESLKFHFDSVAVRCAECRKKRRSEKNLQAQIAESKAMLKKSPDDPALLLSFATALIRCHERVGQGDLNEAIAAARQSQKHWPDSLEPLFWEGLAHYLAGRLKKAEVLLRRYLELASGTHRQRSLRVEAVEVLDSIAGHSRG